MKYATSTIAILVSAFLSASAAPIEQNIPSQEEVYPEELTNLAIRDDDITTFGNDFETYSGYGAEYGAEPQTFEAFENAEGAFVPSQYKDRDLHPRQYPVPAYPPTVPMPYPAPGAQPMPVSMPVPAPVPQPMPVTMPVPAPVPQPIPVSVPVPVPAPRPIAVPVPAAHPAPVPYPATVPVAIPRPFCRGDDCEGDDD